MKKLALILFFFVPLLQVRAADIRDSVVKIHVTRRLPDFLRPWTKASPTEISGSGAIISGKRILTNAHVVLYGQRIFIQPHQSSERIRARVVAIAPEMDLAVLTTDDSFFEKRPTLELAKNLPRIKDTINAYGYPIGGQQMSVTEGIVSRIEFAGYYYSTAGLRIQVDAALNSGNSGGPAIAGGKIAGLVFSRIGAADNIGYIIPAAEVREFLDDVKDGKYDGKAKLLATVQTVENQSLRERLKLPKSVGGLMIKKLIKNGKQTPLKKFDVITHVGEYALDNRGNIQVNKDLRLSFQYIIPKVSKNGTVELRVHRDGKSMRVLAPTIVSRNWLIPWLKGSYPRHFVVGPMVFMPASQDLVDRLGTRGQAALRSKENPIIARRGEVKSFPDQELVVLGARLFAHRTSQGYSPQIFGVVSQVNQTKVKNLNHLVELIRDAKGEFLTLEVTGSYETLVFRRQEVLDATDEILDDEGIRRQYSDDIEKIWKKK